MCRPRRWKRSTSSGEPWLAPTRQADCSGLLVFRLASLCSTARRNTPRKTARSRFSRHTDLGNATLVGVRRSPVEDDE